MPQSKPIYVNRAAAQFRAIIRPEMFGNIGRIEPLIAPRAADALNAWLFDVVREALADSDIKSRKGEIRKQLTGGIRVYGRSSLAQLRGQINVQPWVFPHEYGGKLTPRGRYLAIPFGYALRGDGSPKFSSPNSWRRFNSYVIENKKKGKLYIVYKAANGDLRFLYTLVDSVTIPARLGLNRMAQAELGSLMAEWGRIYINVVRAMPEIFEQWLK
jgi:hypothetical protein